MTAEIGSNELSTTIISETEKPMNISQISQRSTILNKILEIQPDTQKWKTGYIICKMMLILGGFFCLISIVIMGFLTILAGDRNQTEQLKRWFVNTIETILTS